MNIIKLAIAHTVASILVWTVSVIIAIGQRGRWLRRITWPVIRWAMARQAKRNLEGDYRDEYFETVISGKGRNKYIECGIAPHVWLLEEFMQLQSFESMMRRLRAAAESGRAAAESSDIEDHKTGEITLGGTFETSA